MSKGKRGRKRAVSRGRERQGQEVARTQSRLNRKEVDRNREQKGTGGDSKSNGRKTVQSMKNCKAEINSHPAHPGSKKEEVGGVEKKG